MSQTWLKMVRTSSAIVDVLLIIYFTYFSQMFLFLEWLIALNAFNVRYRLLTLLHFLHDFESAIFLALFNAQL